MDWNPFSGIRMVSADASGWKPHNGGGGTRVRGTAIH